MGCWVLETYVYFFIISQPGPKAKWHEIHNNMAYETKMIMIYEYLRDILPNPSVCVDYENNKRVFLISRGDRVEIMVGKDKGKQGIISQVIQERNWVIVEGLNTHLRIVSIQHIVCFLYENKINK